MTRIECATIKVIDNRAIRCDRFRADEPQLVLGRALNKLVMDPLEAVWIRLPWLAA